MGKRKKEDNLTPFTSVEEARESGRKGGIKSGEARREKKRLRECAEVLLSLPVTDTKKFNKLSALGVELDDIDNRMVVVAALMLRAQSGDVFAIKEIRDLIGEAGSEGSGEAVTIIDDL